MRLTPIGGAALVLAVAGCSDVLPPSGPLALGTWGGENAGVIVTETATHVHVGCTLGDIPTRISPGSNGLFDVTGTYVLRAFPIQLGPELPARFTGRATGNTLRLSVTVNDTTTGKTVELGPVTVRLGQTPNIGPCPICRYPKPNRERAMKAALSAVPDAAKTRANAVTPSEPRR